MADWSTASLAALIAVSATMPVVAQNRAPIASPQNTANSPATLTGKERLGRKWMDEQRIDNCNVPVDRRGSKPRPTACAHVPTG
jgi:hypothetical protein